MSKVSSHRDSFRDPILRGLTAEEVRILQRLLHRMQQQVPTNLTALDSQPTEQYTPYILPTAPVGCYVAQAPIGGIPYAVYHYDSGATGTGGIPLSFTPGVAESQIFYHAPEPSVASGTTGNDGDYVPMDDVVHRIFNPSTTLVPEGTFVPVVRDADGNWIVISTVSDASVALPLNEIGYGTGVGITSEPHFLHSQSGNVRSVLLGTTSAGNQNSFVVAGYSTSDYSVSLYTGSLGTGGVKYTSTDATPTIINLVKFKHTPGGFISDCQLFNLPWDVTDNTKPSEDALVSYNLADDQVQWVLLGDGLYIDHAATPGTLKRWVSPPASASASGTAGQTAYDSAFLYVCTATNTWKRVAIATW